MRSFNANFIIEKNKRADGPTPINLLTFGFAAPVYLSDRDITPSGGPAHQGIVKSWGFVDSSITQTPGSGVLGSIDIADLQLTLINSTSPPFSAKFTDTDPPENVIVTLYQWFGGRPSSEKEIIFKGLISGGTIKYDLYTCTLTVRGIFEKYNKQIGADMMITPDAYPDADPDEYGKMSNIIYGDILNVLCRAIVSGDVNSLVADITAEQGRIELSDSSYFPESGVIGCEAEQISYTHNVHVREWHIGFMGGYWIEANTLTGCTRGYGGTPATTHFAGAPVWEELAVFVYQIAGHPIKAINYIYVDAVRITSLCTKYTGQTGNALAGYEGQAVFTIPFRLTRQQAIDLLLADGITIDDAIAVVDTIGVGDSIGVDTGSHSHQPAETPTYIWKFDAVLSFTNVGHPEMLIDGNMQTQTYVLGPSSGNANITVGKAIYDVGPGAPIQYRYCFKTGLLYSGNWSYAGGTCYADNTVYKTSWLTNITTWAAFNSLQAQITTNNGYNGGMGAGAADLWLEIQYNPTTAGAATGVAKTGAATKTGAANKSGTVTRNGAVTLSGNSVADVRIGTLITANVQGYQDDASGTYTGTPNALITRPDHVFKHIWCVLLSALLADVDAASFAAAGVYYAANNYQFGLLINQQILAADLFMRLALQCRSRFLVTAYGTAKLFVRQLAQSSGHAIAKNEIKRDSVSVERSPATEIINLLNIHYDLDNTKEAGSPESYQAAITLTGAASIVRYGQREWKGAADLFCFNAVRLPAMAQHVAGYYLDYHQRGRKMPHFGVFLDNMEIEPGDIIDITHPLDAMAGFTVEVQKIMHHLGNAKQIDYVEIVAVEN